MTGVVKITRMTHAILITIRYVHGVSKQREEVITMAAMKEVHDKMSQVCELCGSSHCHNCRFHIQLDNGDSIELYNKEIVKVTKKGE